MIVSLPTGNGKSICYWMLPLPSTLYVIALLLAVVNTDLLIIACLGNSNLM